MTEMMRGAGFGPTPSIDPASLAAQIDRAVAALEPGRHGALMLSADLTQGSAALVLHFGAGELVARVTKPWQGKLGADITAKISFLVPQEPQPITLRDVYGILRHCGNSRFWSLLKAVALKAGAKVPLMDGGQ